MRVTPEIIELARNMLANGQDWSPEADKILSEDNSLCLCSYPDGAWIADTHGEVNMNRWTKLECVIPVPLVKGTATIPIPASRKELLAIAHCDHDASLVGIDDDLIRRTQWPLESLQPMIMGLNGAITSTGAGALSFLIIMTALNYRFWEVQGNEIRRYSHRGKTGARALWAAFEDAWGLDSVSPIAFERRLADQGVEGLFGEIPDPASRDAILRELLSGDIVGVSAALSARIDAAHSVTVADASALAEELPMAFGDPYLKKAQLALSMYSAFLRHCGTETDATDLTAFADYQVPRVLRALGILRYSDDLAERVDSGMLLPNASREERAIRAATILACERIAAHCQASAADVDSLLWSSQEVAADSRFHLTLTTWY